MTILEILIANQYDFNIVVVTKGWHVPPDSKTRCIELYANTEPKSPPSRYIIDQKTIQTLISRKEGTSDYLEILYEFQYLNPLLFKRPNTNIIPKKEPAAVMLPTPKK